MRKSENGISLCPKCSIIQVWGLANSENTVIDSYLLNAL